MPPSTCPLPIQIQNVLRVIDGPNKCPTNGVEHLMLIGRKVHMTIDHMRATVRRVTKPLIDVCALELHGTAILAEPRPAPKAMTTVPVCFFESANSGEGFLKLSMKLMVSNLFLIAQGLPHSINEFDTGQGHDALQALPRNLHDIGPYVGLL